MEKLSFTTSLQRRPVTGEADSDLIGGRNVSAISTCGLDMAGNSTMNILRETV